MLSLLFSRDQANNLEEVVIIIIIIIIISSSSYCCCYQNAYCYGPEIKVIPLKV
jgi:hypothetical protein